ncbi:uncharacterized protein LOC142319917 [Lycorma delicatula]|uniref:uncharacterized protein LOC142319917 n=1 Tax=Lycorma delicatula TaxID=130591 RepID=UPI003F51AA6C
MAFWVAPATQNKYSRHTGGRSEENCNPCNKFPWVPVPRALPAVPAILSSNGDQFSLTIPAVSLQYGAPVGGNNNSPQSVYGVPSNGNKHYPKPVYGAPVDHNKPIQSFGSDFGGKPPPPSPSQPPHHQPQYNPPPPVHKPSQSYGIPSDLGKIPLSYSNTGSLDYPPNIQHSAPSSIVQQKVQPLLVHTPIPFPSMSQGPLPPLFQYQQFADTSSLSSYLQPPAPSNGHGIVKEEEEQHCGKCSAEELIPNDSVPAQAQHQETGSHLQAVTNNHEGVEVMKSVPLAEYLSSVEYPLQVVQAPIVDVADLPKYINLQFPGQNGPGFLQHSGHALFVNHGLKVETSSKLPSDNILSASSLQNKLPENERASSTTTAATTISEPIKSTLYSSSLPVSTFPTTKQPYTSTSKPSYYSTISQFMPPLPDPPQQFYREFNTSSLDQQSNTFIRGGVPSSMIYLNPPPLKGTPSNNWSGQTTSVPLTYSYVPTNQPRFPSQRPNIVSTQSAKKPKHVHQIIVPYTTKHIQNTAIDNPGWTPVPPQARKVPMESIGNGHQNNITYSIPTGLHLGESIPFSSTASEQLESYKLPSPEEGVTPELVSQLLNFEEGNNQNSIRAVVHPGDVHHVLAANLKALLRGEEDSVDLQRLQKNIDNWTAEGYKTNSPPENFHTLTTLGHLSPSKNIPVEYFTTPSAFDDNNSNGHRDKSNNNFNSNNNNITSDLGDYETSGSQNHPVRTSSHVHTKASDEQESEVYESWSLLDTKLKPSVTSAPRTTADSVNEVSLTDLETTTVSSTTKPSTSTDSASVEVTQPTSKAWEQLQVSISPLTKEKVYVVTPQPVASEVTTPLTFYEHVPTSITSTRVDRSYSVETAKRTTRYLHESLPAQKEPRSQNNNTRNYTSTKSLDIKVANKAVPTVSKPTLKDSMENINPIDDNSRFGIKLIPDGKNNRLRRYQDNKGYFRFFPELLKASDYLEDGDIEQIRRVAFELKKEGST